MTRHGFCREELKFVDAGVQWEAQCPFDSSLPQPLVELLVLSKPYPLSFEGFCVGCQQTGFGLHDRITHTGYIETNRWRSPHRRFRDDEPPTLPGSGMKQDPRFTHELVLLGLRDIAGE